MQASDIPVERAVLASGQSERIGFEQGKQE